MTAKERERRLAEQQHSLWAKVFVGVVVSLVVALLTWLVLALGRPLLGLVVRGWALLGRDVRVPVWLLLVAAALAIVTLVRAVLSFVWPDPRVEPPAWHDYTEDSFLGCNWRWQYFRNDVTDLDCYCPKCDNQVVFVQNRHLGPNRNTTILECERCGWASTRLKGLAPWVRARVTREIDRKLRSGEWKQVVHPVEQEDEQP